MNPGCGGLLPERAELDAGCLHSPLQRSRRRMGPYFGGRTRRRAYGTRPRPTAVTDREPLSANLPHTLKPPPGAGDYFPGVLGGFHDAFISRFSLAACSRGRRTTAERRRVWGQDGCRWHGNCSSTAPRLHPICRGQSRHSGLLPGRKRMTLRLVVANSAPRRTPPCGRRTSAANSARELLRQTTASDRGRCPGTGHLTGMTFRRTCRAQSRDRVLQGPPLRNADAMLAEFGSNPCCCGRPTSAAARTTSQPAWRWTATVACSRPENRSAPATCRGGPGFSACFQPANAGG